MQNLNDDNHLDNLSRKAAEEFQPDQEIHSWEKLHPRLEAAMPQKKERRRRFLFILFMFLLVGGGITLSAILINRQRADTAEQIDNGTPGTSANNTKTADEPATVTTNDKSNDVNKKDVGKNNIAIDNQPAQRTQEQNTYIQPKRPLTGTGKSPGNNNRPVNNKPAGTDNVKTGEPKKTDQSITNPPVVVDQSTVQSDKTGDKKNDPTSKDGGKEDKDNKNADNPADSAVKAADKATDNKIDQPAPAGDQITAGKTTPKNNKQTPPLKNRWEFGLAYAPDISTVKFSHTQEPGHNIGLTIGYNISRRFSLQTGVLYTIKNYKSNGSDYHPPKGYWTDYVKLETVTGSCNMWDIPLNLRYNVAPRKKSNFFVSTGLSSYLMNKEDYDFFYYYSGAPVTRYRSMETGNKHWMSVLNLSLGYERQLNKTFSLQVEPFFKQPLKGVGFGSMKLNTTGVYFTLKYKPLSGRLSP